MLQWYNNLIPYKPSCCSAAPNKSSSSQKEKKDSGDDSREPSPPLPNGSGDGKSGEKGKSFASAKTNDVVREKCQEMIAGALKVPSK